MVSFEPVPIFRAFLEYSAARNHLTSFMEVIPALVADDVERSYTVNVPLSGSWGQSGMYVQHMHNRLQASQWLSPMYFNKDSALSKRSAEQQV